jgi:hypothetical protein
MSDYVPPACVYKKDMGLLLRQRVSTLYCGRNVTLIPATKAFQGPPAIDKDAMEIYTSPEQYIRHSRVALPKPALVINLISVKQNCKRMLDALKEHECAFRVDTGVMKVGRKETLVVWISLMKYRRVP